MHPLSNQAFSPSRTRKPQLSRHASVRSQQRGLRQECIPLLLAYGEASHDGRGGIRYFMSQSSLQRLVRAVGYTQMIDALAGTYLVVSADDAQTVITMGHKQ